LIKVESLPYDCVRNQTHPTLYYSYTTLEIDLKIIYTM